MYDKKQDYENMLNITIEIYLDYNFNSFPIDEKLVCNKLGINLVPYSAYNKNEIELLKKQSKDAFITPFVQGKKRTIYYNDDLNDNPNTRIRYSIFHEIKHYVNNDLYYDEKSERMADYFAKIFMCPIPYLIYMNVCDINEIIAKFNVSKTVASHIVGNLKNRKKTYGNNIFDNEKPLIKLLCGVEF